MRFIKGSFNPQPPYPSASESVGGRGDCGLKHPLVVVGQEKIHTYMACGTVPVSFEEAGICFCGVKIAKIYFLSKNFGKNLTKYGTGALEDVRHVFSIPKGCGNLVP